MSVEHGAAAEVVYHALKRKFGTEPDDDYGRACWYFQRARALRAEAARFEGDRSPFEWIEPESDWLWRMAEIERTMGRFYRALWQDTQPPRWARGRLSRAATLCTHRRNAESDARTQT